MFIRYGLGLICLCALIISCKEERTEEAGQTALPFATADLHDLDGFEETQGWTIAGDVLMDRNDPGGTEIKEGKGIVVSPTGQPATLTTRFSHDDLDLKMDFMLAKGAAASLQFQGSYEVTLADAWRSAGAGCGKIFINKDSALLPPLNACKAPGLWQHLYVKFKAPRYDKEGAKISDAVIKEIYLNNKLIFENVRLASPHQKSSGPVELSVRKGTVAFRAIQYKSYTQDRIRLGDMKYEVYEGLYKNLDTIKNFTPLRTGTADSLHWSYGDQDAQISLSGTMQVPVEGNYIFMIRGGGPCGLFIEDREIVNNGGTRDFTDAHYGMVSLKAGAHPFKVIYANHDKSLVLEYEGPHIPVTTLTAPTAERHVRKAPPLEYKIMYEPGIQRGFFTHHGEVNPYTMAVGIPGGLNYAYDMTTFNLLTVWRGRFIDVSNMWMERGESQMEIPLGAPLELAGIPGVLRLNDKADAWTDTVAVDNNIYTNRGYRLGDGGLPVFMYGYRGMAVEDNIKPANEGAGLIRSVKVTFKEPAQQTWFLLGSGRAIDKLPGGGYAIDEKEYYIESVNGVEEGMLSVVKANNGRYELRLPFSGMAGETIAFDYSIIW